jgi:glycosyltransferase involved in cell wall biosynthesis
VEDVSLSGGGARPIFNYYNSQLAKKKKEIILIRLVYKNSLIKLIYLAFFSEKIIINSLICFKYWTVILICYLKKNTIIYVHDSAPHTKPFAERHPLKFKHFLRLLQKRKVAFVSEWQSKYFLQQVSIPRYKIIYNNINFPYERSTENTITIAMVAYQNENKNVSFFSKVADEAFNQKLPYTFNWAGGQGGETAGLYHSQNVQWLGDQEHVMDILNNIDVFLFTSQADSFPLVFAEVLFKGKRIVSYTENGFASHITSLKGCKLYNSFNENIVLSKIEEVLKETVDVHKHKELAYSLCSIENFENRLEEVFTI